MRQGGSSSSGRGGARGTQQASRQLRRRRTQVARRTAHPVFAPAPPPLFLAPLHLPRLRPPKTWSRPQVAARQVNKTRKKPPKPGRTLTDEVWPWSHLVPFFLQDMRARVGGPAAWRLPGTQPRLQAG
jgi:hypothetical protein